MTWNIDLGFDIKSDIAAVNTESEGCHDRQEHQLVVQKVCTANGSPYSPCQLMTFWQGFIFGKFLLFVSFPVFPQQQTPLPIHHGFHFMVVWLASTAAAGEAGVKQQGQHHNSSNSRRWRGCSSSGNTTIVIPAPTNNSSNSRWRRSQAAVTTPQLQCQHQQQH